MKVSFSFCLICLVFPIHAYDTVNTIKNRRILEASTLSDQDESDYGRLSRIIPTLLKKFLALRRRFDNYDDVIGDVLFGMAPSDAPSTAPSDAPSQAPSDSPSATPTYTPSAAPFTWNDVLGNDSIDYKTCPLDPIPVNFTTTTELTVLYSYMLELQSDAQVFKTIGKVEDLLQIKLVDRVCNTKSDTFGVSARPSDIPGGMFSLFCNHIYYIKIIST
jgi:hypothetical protein